MRNLKWKHKRRWLVCLRFLCLVYALLIAWAHAVNELVYIGYGGQHTVSGSLHVLDADGDLYLVDVGIFMGEEGENYPWPAEVPIERIQAVFITHAHADHIGRVPLLLHEGYTGPLYMTAVTYDLAQIALVANLNLVDFGVEEFYYSRNNQNERKPVYLEGYDFGQFTVREHNRVYINARRYELDGLGFYLHREQLRQLEEELLGRLAAQVRVVHPGERVEVGPFSVRFLPTSHMPGSVMIAFTLQDFRVLFSGDVGSDSSPLLPPNPTIEMPVDVLVVEGTYASDRHLDYALEREMFRQRVGELVEQGYRVVIPAFVMDRTQQVLYELSRGMLEGFIPAATPVAVYSSTANEITDLYEHYRLSAADYAPYFTAAMASARFKPLMYREARTFWDEMDPLRLKPGEIGVMSSGMAEHAFARQALFDYLEDPGTVFFFVGYQGEGTPGRALTEGATHLNLDGRQLEVNARIERTSAFSGHAGPADILSLLREVAVQRVFLVHLEAANAPELAQRYRDALGADVVVPTVGERHLLYEQP